MSDPVQHTDEQPPPSAEFEALNTLVEAFLEVMGEDSSLTFLRKVAAEVDGASENVVALRDGSAGARAKRQCRAWLRRSVTVWLARHA